MALGWVIVYLPPKVGCYYLLGVCGCIVPQTMPVKKGRGGDISRGGEGWGILMRRKKIWSPSAALGGALTGTPSPDFQKEG
jgi:hypothetical protein